MERLNGTVSVKLNKKKVFITVCVSYFALCLMFPALLPNTCKMIGGIVSGQVHRIYYETLKASRGEIAANIWDMGKELKKISFKGMIGLD